MSTQKIGLSDLSSASLTTSFLGGQFWRKRKTEEVSDKTDILLVGNIRDIELSALQLRITFRWCKEGTEQENSKKWERTRFSKPANEISITIPTAGTSILFYVEGAKDSGFPFLLLVIEDDEHTSTFYSVKHEGLRMTDGIL